MSNDHFQFKQFTIRQDRCGMKVGTDGTLLGAWAQAPRNGRRILDIGTGTGLIALMMAQRYPEVLVTGVDIDADAVSQAYENVGNSPFADRVEIREADVLTLADGDGYDAIVCNPPYFSDALTSPDAHRTVARHTVSLTYEALAAAASRLLAGNGLFSVVIPADRRSDMESAASLYGLFESRVCLIKTRAEKPPKRCLIEFSKTPVNQVDMTIETLEKHAGERSDWYQALTKDFYIR